MIVDIRFKDKAPTQFQKVRMTTIYVNADLHGAEPELVIHFYDAIYPQVNINLASIHAITTTND